MKAVFVSGPSKVAIREQGDPVAGGGEILVRMDACGICGSDVEKVFGRYGKPSMRLGHEPAGTVLEVGAGVRGYKAGDRVFTHHHVPCGSCRLCRHGNETMCRKYSESNLNPCGLAQKYIVPKWNVENGGVLKLPESMSFDEAAMIEPLACCIRAWNRTAFGSGDSVAIFGVGPTGMMHAMLAKNCGAEKIFCLDVNDFRLEFARKSGVTEAIGASDPGRTERILAQTDGGVDLAIVATSSLAALRDAVGMLRRGGTAVMFGVPTVGDTAGIDMGAVYSKEITLVTSYAASDLDTKKALQLIDSKKIDAGGLITHRYSLTESQRAFEHARSGKDAMKIIIGRP